MPPPPENTKQNWHRLGETDVLSELQTQAGGLSSAAADERRGKYGPNELVEKGAKRPLAMIWEQLTAVMVLILVAAAGLSLLLGKYVEASAILAIVVLFTLLGFLQEYRAEKAIAALKKLAVPNVRAYRDGTLQEISGRGLVPGDVIALEAGNLLPADVRVLESVNLRVQEAALTGESEPIEKTTGPLDKADVSLGDRTNMAFMGTLVTYGRGSAVVVATGMSTELGKIADLLQSVKNEMTPLQQRLDGVGKQLAIAGVVVAVLIAGLGMLMGESFGDMVLTAISVAVAVIPEGLPAVVTFTLALGARRMLARNALIRKLPAVETLGSVTTICSDKTGTLTQNRMTVTMVEVAGAKVDLSEALREETSAPAFGEPLDELRPGSAPGLGLLLAGGALCNDGTLRVEPSSGRYEAIGDPTETALLVAAGRGGLIKDALEHAMPRVAELPFDSERKRMTTVHRRAESGLGDELLAVWGKSGYAPEEPYIAVTKGAADGLLEVATHVWKSGRAEPLTDELRRSILAGNERMARNGMRVLGVAFRPLSSTESLQEVESELVFLGLTGMIDPPRPEVRAAVARCATAGIRPVMITGDHPLTASYIARDLGIARDETVVTGTQLNAMSPAELEEAAASVSVFARVSPEHKLAIVAALQKQGQVVAMTGDGVNDAPALKKADIGVAMGITGTDVSKEASDMVLRDDNFATIVASVEEGRVIYDNLRRFVKFAVAGNIGKVLVMLAWPLPFLLLGMPIDAPVALLPLQLLWLNLMTDGLLGLSMGVEAPERNVMSRPPHKTTDGIFSGGMGWQVTWAGAAIGLASLGVGFAYYRAGLSQWQSVMFTSLAFLQVFQALGTRSNTESLFSMGVFSNRVMWGIIALVVSLQLIALYTPLGAFLGLQPLSAFDLLVSIGLGVALLVVLEVEKALLRARRTTNQAGRATAIHRSA